MTKENLPQEGIAEYVVKLLEEIQNNLFDNAIKYREEHTTEVDTFEDFKDVIKNKGGFVLAHWDGTAETEERIKDLTKATIRCIPLNNKKEAGKCILTGADSEQRVLFARAY